MCWHLQIEWSNVLDLYGFGDLMKRLSLQIFMIRLYGTAHTCFFQMLYL